MIITQKPVQCHSSHIPCRSLSLLSNQWWAPPHIHSVMPLLLPYIKY